MVYQHVLGAAAPVVTVGTVAMLPATGMNLLTSVAVSLGAGLVTWGVVYVLQHGKTL